jgi:hypothetical protein
MSAECQIRVCLHLNGPDPCLLEPGNLFPREVLQREFRERRAPPQPECFPQQGRPARLITGRDLPGLRVTRAGDAPRILRIRDTTTCSAFEGLAGRSLPHR